MDEVAAFLGKWTPGGVGIWTLVALVLVGWWKGLPSIIDAISNRNSKIEDRMDARLKEADIRFKAQIEAADKRHDDCMAANEKLSGRMAAAEEHMAKQSRIIAEQGEQLVQAQDTIAGLKRQIVQMQISTMRTIPNQAADGIMDHMVAQLDQVAGVKR